MDGGDEWMADPNYALYGSNTDVHWVWSSRSLRLVCKWWNQRQCCCSPYNQRRYYSILYIHSAGRQAGRWGWLALTSALSALIIDRIILIAYSGRQITNAQLYVLFNLASSYRFISYVFAYHYKFMSFYIRDVVVAVVSSCSNVYV